MPFDTLTLKELKEFEKISPLLAGFPSRILAEGYKDFMDILYDDIDKTIYQIEENPELRQNGLCIATEKFWSLRSGKRIA